jgi:uncharacterized membrane protein (DUF2068 family)
MTVSTDGGRDARLREPPGARPRPKRGRARFSYELLGCAWHGHELVGRDAATVRPVDAPLAREHDGLRWHRCLRCDAWVPLHPPETPSRENVPQPNEVTVPERGKLLRDRYVLRLIAIDRFLHFLVLGALAVGIFVFAHARTSLSGPYFRILDAVQGGVGGRTGSAGHGILEELTRLFNARTSTLWLIGLAVAGYAVLEGVEAVGLWFAKRWAEYLTFVATAVLLVPEVYELTVRISPLKVVTLVINLAVVVYLLFAKRLFGLRGGSRGEAEERERDTGWSALEGVLPGR